MDRLDTGPVGAAGGDVLKGSDGERMGLVVEARAVLTGKPDRPLQPTLRQDEVGVRIGCKRDRSVAMRGQRQFDSQRIPRCERDPRRGRVCVSHQDEHLIGCLTCDIAVEAGRRWRCHQRCAMSAQRLSRRLRALRLA